MKTQHGGRRVLLAGSLSLALLVGGCAGTQSAGKQPASEPEAQGWVVIQSAESVKPKTGIAREIKQMKNLRIIDFISEDQAIGYKLSDTVFGEDRGLCLFNVKTGAIDRYYKTGGTYFKGQLSPDKKQLAFTTDSGSDLSGIQFLDLETGQLTQWGSAETYRENLSLSYSMDRNFRWDQSGNGIFSPYDSSKGVQFSIIGKGQGTTYSVDATALESVRMNTYSLWDFSVAGQAWYGLVSDGSQNTLMTGRLETTSKGSILERDITRMNLVDEGKGLLMIRRNQNGGEDQLVLKAIEKGKNTVLLQMKGLQDFEVSGDYAVLKQFDLEKGLSLYLVSLKTKNVSYVTTYQKESIGKLAVSPKGDLISVDFDYQKPLVDGKPVNHLILLK